MSGKSNCSVLYRCALLIQNKISVKTAYNKLTGRVLQTPALSSAIWLSSRQICFAKSRVPSHYTDDATGWQVHRICRHYALKLILSRCAGLLTKQNTAYPLHGHITIPRIRVLICVQQCTLSHFTTDNKHFYFNV